jgi:hypothetical protein
MVNYRFKVGTTIMCNLGQSGWKTGRIIALDYREDSWPEGEVAPYQVALEDDYSLIYVPVDDDRFCREITNEDVMILQRKDALAAHQPTTKGKKSKTIDSSKQGSLCCSEQPSESDLQSYRKGRCFCCNDCPREWSYAELYSEYYTCASRNNLNISRHTIDLGTLNVGESIQHNLDEFSFTKKGFMQAPTLVKLPPGVLFSDEGTLTGEPRYDPYRGASYEVDFVAVSTVDWNDASAGIVRLEIRFTVEGNEPPKGFDVVAFQNKQTEARAGATELLKSINSTWTRWEKRQLGSRATCDAMLADLEQLRTLLESNPRLDNGKWWGHLGGYHMNVHKLLENTLFECELYLGYALTFGDDEVRYYAEQNLKGCYQKRLLESARFMWYDGIELVLKNDWQAAIEVFRAAADKKEGWGWAVNHGDIWISEAVAIIMQAVEGELKKSKVNDSAWLDNANELIQRAKMRADESGVFGNNGHPWITEVGLALDAYNGLVASDNNLDLWYEEFNARMIYWCSQVLAGISPFPPQVRARLASESMLIEMLPGYNS